MESASRHKTLDIQRGLFLVRYESAEDDARPPRVTVSRDPGSGGIDFILPPDADEPVLWSPGASLVVKAERAGRLRVAVEPSAPDGSVAAKIQLTALSDDPGGARAMRDLVGDLDLSGFRVLGHVAGIGDVFADPEEWIGGPMAPSRIEGFALQWPQIPRDVGLRYSVRVGGQRPATTEPVMAGGFAGTRGRALPLLGATLEISGPGARDHQLVVDAIFLGSPQMRVTGQRAVLAGPSGREPLVGLRVGIEAINQPKPVRERPAVPDSRPAPPTPSKPASKKGSERVRVFRSAAAGRTPGPAPSETKAARAAPDPETTRPPGRVRVFAVGSTQKGSKSGS
jgi:hypothetical protein